jgi:hypothetical protein
MQNGTINTIPENFKEKINNLLLSSGITPNTKNVGPSKINEIINKIKEDPELAPLVIDNQALIELLKPLNRKGGARYKKTRKQKGGVRLALFLAALTYPFLGATHSPGNTLQFKTMRAFTAAVRAKEAAKHNLRKSKKEGMNMTLGKYSKNSIIPLNHPHSAINTSKFVPLKINEPNSN